MKYNAGTTIDELREAEVISVRTYNGLNTANLKTIGEIQSSINTIDDLLKLRNIGHKSAYELSLVLAKVGKEEMVPVDQPKNKYLNIPRHISFIIDKHYNELVAPENKFSNIIKQRYPNPWNINDEIDSENKGLLNTFPGLTKDENIEVREAYLLFLKNCVKDMEFHYYDNSNIFKKYYLYHIYLESSRDHFLYIDKLCFLCPEALKYLRVMYKEMYNDTLSVRGRHFMEKHITTYDEFISYIDSSRDDLNKICPSRKIDSTLDDIYNFIRKFVSVIDDIAECSPEDIPILIMKRDYPFLTSNQRKFVVEFEAEKGYRPLFYLLYQYMRITEVRNENIFSLTYGIFDGKERTLREVASIKSISLERVRQILCSVRVDLEKQIKYCDIQPYRTLLNLPYIVDDLKVYKSLAVEEGIDAPFGVFARLVTLFSHYKVEEFKGKKVLLNTKKLDGFDFDECCERVERVVSSRYSDDVEVSIDNLVEDIDVKFRKCAKEITRYILTEVYDIPISKQDTFIIQQNHIDITKDVCDILEQNGKPMFLDEIFVAFKKKYPDHRFTEANSIRCYMKGEIRPLGKRSYYALAKWDNVFFGSIRDHVVENLKDSVDPVHIETLFEVISQYHPETNVKSIVTSLKNDEHDRFCFYENGFIGLKSKVYSPEYVILQPIARIPFEERIRAFKEFVDTYRRFPSYSGSAEESSLTRWYYNMNAGLVDYTPEQYEDYETMLKNYDNAGIPRTTKEYEFLNNCNEFR